MCWATPARVVRVYRDRSTALVEAVDGSTFEAVIAIDPSEVREGDTVLVHAGMVISRLEEDAERLRLLEEMVRELAGGEDVGHEL